MPWVWLGLMSLSGSWLFLFPVFWPEPQWGPGVGLAGAGFCLLFAGFRSCRFAGLRWAMLLGLLVFGLQLLALQAVRPVAAQWHDLGVLTPALHGMCRMAGLPASHDQGLLFLHTEEGVVPFVTNWEKLGLVLPLTLWIGLAVCVLLSRTGWGSQLKGLALGTAALLLYVMVRYLVICGYLAEFEDLRGEIQTNPMWAFAGPWRTLFTFLPFALVGAKLKLIAFLPSPDRRAPGSPALTATWSRGFGFGRRLTLSIALTTAAVALLLVAINLRLPGPAKPGRILVDDFHSGFWEPSALALDTTGFTSKNLYSYSSLIEWLKYYFSVTINESEELTERRLQDVDVLIIKTPSKRFSTTEIAAIVRFVRQGGGLFLIGDHTNLLGMGSFLNELASHFGIRFRYDACNAFSNGYFSLFHSPRLFAHPIVQGLGLFKFMTSCTLACDWRAERVMDAYDLASDPVDYSKPSFFGRLIPGTKSGFGIFTVAAAARAGRGRVLALADSTPFSNFSMFQEAYPEFFLNALTYLNQTNPTSHWTRTACALVGFGLILIGLFLSTTCPSPTLSILTAVCAGGLGGLFIAGYALSRLHAHAFQPGPAHSAYPQVAFLTDEHLAFGLPPAIGPAFIPLPYCFDSLFVVPQRFGAFPVLFEAARMAREGFAAPERVAHGRKPSASPLGEQPANQPFRAVVLINPDDKLAVDCREVLVRYMQTGGHVILFKTKGVGDQVIQSLTQADSSSHMIHDQHYLIALPTNTPPALTNSAPFQPPLADVPTNVVAAPTNTLSLQLGAAQTAPTNLQPTAVRWAIGRGTLDILSDSVYFSRASLGHVMFEPDDSRLRLYQILFEAFGDAIGPVARPRLK